MRKTLLSAALVTLLAAGCFPVPPTPPAPKADSAAASAPTQGPTDPYPHDCAIVRQWLHDRYGEDAQIVDGSWERWIGEVGPAVSPSPRIRIIGPNKGIPGAIHVTAKVRHTKDGREDKMTFHLAHSGAIVSVDGIH
jgi:hypothetical protein